MWCWVCLIRLMVVLVVVLLYEKYVLIDVVLDGIWLVWMFVV